MAPADEGLVPVVEAVGAAEVMSQELNNGEGVKASMLAEFNRAAASLMTTEGERRRLRVELQAADGAVVDDESSSVMSHYKELFM